MKRIPPSVRMKEEVTALLGGETVEGAPPQAPMRGFVRSLARLIQQVFLAPSHALALKRGRALIARFGDRYPAAMQCLERDLEECVTYLRFPAAHHHRIRTTNRLERLNVEDRRPPKVLPRFPTERSCLTLL